MERDCGRSVSARMIGGGAAGRMDRRRTVALVEGLLAVAVWGASFIATKVALAEVSPATVVWLRFAMGVAVLGVVAAARRQLTMVPARELALYAVLGFVGITLHQWLQSNALVTSRASTSGWIIAATPVFMAILGRVVLGERLGLKRIGGIALAACGVLLVVTRGQLATLAAGRFGAPGDVLMLLSAPNWAIFSVLSRRTLRTQPASRTMFYVMTFGWALSTVPLAAGPGLSQVALLSARGWAAVAFLGVACSGLAYVAWYDALQRMPAGEAGALLYFEPLIATAVAAAVLGEPIGLATLAGGATILVGVWLVNRGAAAGPVAAVTHAGEE
jgi:drug/metabolite transporter (DMT)-like permease